MYLCIYLYAYIAYIHTHIFISEDDMTSIAEASGERKLKKYNGTDI
jgi:hypothetical protein